MARRQFALQGIEQFFATGLEPPAGQLQHLVRRLSLDERLDHGARRLSMDVADHDPEPNAAIGENLLQAVLLGRQLPDQFLPLARNQAQLTQLHRRDERPAQQAGAGQCGQPLRIAYIGLAPRDMLDVPGIDDLSANAERLQGGIGALPVNAGAFHDDGIGPQCGCPFSQGAPVPLEGAELPLLDARGAIGFFEDGTGCDLRLMHIDSDNAFVKRTQFHLFSLPDQFDNGRRRELN